MSLPNGTTVAAELFRVEVFSDSQCLNMVYSGPVTGRQSWAPRAFGGAAYVLVFQAPPALYAANLSLFAKIAASVKIG